MEGHLFFRDFHRPPPLPFINFSNFTREVNKVLKDNRNFIFSLLYFVPFF